MSERGMRRYTRKSNSAASSPGRVGYEDVRAESYLDVKRACNTWLDGRGFRTAMRGNLHPDAREAQAR